MSVHTRHDLERIGRLARARFSHALMSDTKWRKLFVAVDDAGLRPQRVAIKFIEVDKVYLIGWPGNETMYAPRPWIDTSEFGPIELRSVEWLLIPSVFHEARGSPNVPPRAVRQEIESIRLLLVSLGHFPVEISDEGLRIVGYK